jgi:hypothetical protein
VCSLAAYTKFNSLDHPTAEKLLNEIKDCKASGNCSEAKIRQVIAQYEKLSAARSALIDACTSRACVESIQANSIAMDDPVAKDLLNLFKTSIAYDMYGLMAGDPSKVAIPSQGVDKWGATFVTDDQIAIAKYVKEGWITANEQAQLDIWNSQTEWMDRAAGRQLTPQEKASTLLELTSTAAIGLLGGRGGSGGAKGIDKIFETGRTPKASELKQYAEAQGWKPSQTDSGPLKYVDENGIPRVTIKQGSSRAPGSSDPHVEFKDAAGQRTDAFGNPVTRKSPDNHTSIDFDL